MPSRSTCRRPRAHRHCAGAAYTLVPTLVMPLRFREKNYAPSHPDPGWRPPGGGEAILARPREGQEYVFSLVGSRGTSVGFGPEFQRMSWKLRKSAGFWKTSPNCAEVLRERWCLYCILAGFGGQGLGRRVAQFCRQAWRGCVLAQLFAPNRPAFHMYKRGEAG